MTLASQALDSAAVRQTHLSLVLRTIQSEGEISRADLARRLDLARSTITGLVESLIAERLVRELRPGLSGGGRRPMLLCLDDDTYQLVGVDIGATHVTVVVTNLRADVIARHHRAVAVRQAPEDTLRVTEELISHCLTETRTPRSRFVGIGVGVPSPVDTKSPGQVSAVVLPAWEGVEIVDRLSKRFDVPVRMDNDANLGALWEARWGQASQVDSVAYVKMATGIGAGLVFDGRIHRGTRGVAGELGHISIDTSGPTCTCGLRGCLNVLAGTEHLLAKARKGASGTRPLRHIDDLVDAALARDAAAIETIEYAGRTLGLGLAMLLNLINPAMVIAGGGIVRAGDILMEPMRATVARHSFSENFSHARIVASDTGEATTARGAATLMLDAAIDDPAIFRPRHRRSIA